MPDVPKYETKGKTRHQWTISNVGAPIDSKNFRFGLHDIYKQMEALGLDLGYDDAFHVETTDENKVILFIEVTSDETENWDSEARLAVKQLLKLHREGHNELDRHDHWPSGRCNYDGDEWPCETARICGVTT